MIVQISKFFQKICHMTETYKLSCNIKIFKMEGDNKNHCEYVDEYQIVRVLGSGYSAEVKLGLDLQNKLVAIKQYKHETSTLENLKQELNVMKALNHENLIKLISVKQHAINKKPNQPASNCFAIILQYAGGGELFDFVAETGKFSERVARTYFHQMMNGIHYMHDKGYAHRDIKPQNLLLTSNFILKIADFGFSCLIRGRDGTGILQTKLGTEGYMAPQIALKHYDGRKTDIFAAGVILFIMYSGNPPFEKSIATDPYYKLIKQKRYDIFWNAHSRKRNPGFFSDPFKELVEKMLAYIPSERPTIVQIAKHPWIKGSTCYHAEIVEEFTDRKKRMDAILQKKRIQKEAEKLRRTESIHNQGYNCRDNEESEDTQFISIYNKEKLFPRKLKALEVFSLDDIFLRDNEATFAISCVKQFIRNHKITLNEEDSEEISMEDNDEYCCEEISDHENKIQAKYIFRSTLENEPISSQIQFQIAFGETENKQIQIHFEWNEGNTFYFKKIIKEIKANCFP